MAEIIIVVILVIGLIRLLSKASTDKEPSPIKKQADTDIELENLKKERIAKEDENFRLRNEIIESFKDDNALELEVKGIYYRSKGAKDIIASLTVKDAITLKKEPNNKYDEFAVKVLCYGVLLGYIPQEDSEFVTNLIDTKTIKKIIVSNAGDGKFNFWDEPNHYLEITIFY